MVCILFKTRKERLRTKTGIHKLRNGISSSRGPQDFAAYFCVFIPLCFLMSVFIVSNMSCNLPDDGQKQPKLVVDNK